MAQTLNVNLSGSIDDKIERIAVALERIAVVLEQQPQGAIPTVPYVPLQDTICPACNQSARVIGFPHDRCRKCGYVYKDAPPQDTIPTAPMRRTL